MSKRIVIRRGELHHIPAPPPTQATEKAEEFVVGDIQILAPFGELRLGTVFNYNGDTYIKVRRRANSAGRGVAHLLSDIERFILINNYELVEV